MKFHNGIRLMLGVSGEPALLVEAPSDWKDKEVFDFYVVNGAWNGRLTKESFNTGTVRVEPNQKRFDEDEQNLVEILTDNQDRLRGNYQDVFDNFSNKDYKAPEYKFVAAVDDCYDDDIAF